ncbi:hypothetical protein BGZ65_012583, partial [Modicella reniformis]
MLFRGVVPSTKTTLSAQQALDLSNVYLEKAFKASDKNIALALCHDAEATLHQVKSISKKALTNPKDDEDRALREGVANAYIDIGKLLDNKGFEDEAQAVYKKAEKLGGDIHKPGRLAQSSYSNGTMYPCKTSPDSLADDLTVSRPIVSKRKQHRDIATIPSHIFANDLPPRDMQFKLPETDERLENTRQLTSCLGLLKATLSPNDVLEQAVSNWLQAIEKDKDEQERLK